MYNKLWFITKTKQWTYDNMLFEYILQVKVFILTCTWQLQLQHQRDSVVWRTWLHWSLSASSHDHSLESIQAAAHQDFRPN